MFLRDLARRASMGRREGAATAAAAAERGVDASGAAHAGSPPRSPLFSSRGVGSAPSSPGASPPAASPSSPRPGSAPGAVPPFAMDGGPPEAGPLIRGVGACEEANLRYRPTHEDAHSVDFGVPACDAPAVGGSATPEPHHGVLFGVYDGHGGVEVARCVAPRRCGRGAPTRGADSRRFPTCALCSNLRFAHAASPRTGCTCTAGARWRRARRPPPRWWRRTWLRTQRRVCCPPLAACRFGGKG